MDLEKNKNDNCEEVRRYILENIDWECEVFKKFNQENLGCKYAVSSAIDWFFKNVEEGIILEDDCLPSLSFFKFCENLLEYYRNDTRIMHIGGTNFQDNIKRGEYTYYFSKYVHIWGWATWRRAWKYYDVNIKTINDFIKENAINNIFDFNKERKLFLRIFLDIYNNKIDTWDYQWFYTVISQNGLAITPNLNMVSNIGFGDNATHTKSKNSKFSKMDIFEVNEIIHPKFVLQNKEADKYTYENVFKQKNIVKKIINKIFDKITL
ncbi:MAG: hypothetical protein KatS3mg068_2171 [Candidatus Sericytochromatia bacterium]|nr:MAG: hypothetical protein KatS3mg068_2171 [Candidatus Sericytochromatia bacterium]